MSTPYPFDSNEDNDPLEEEGTPKNQRRFNQLSWLLECGMCTSATPIKKKFYISTNEFSNKTKGRRKNKQVDFICEVMEYFRDLANGPPQMWEDESKISEKRDEIMRSICLNQIRVATFGRVMVSPDIFKTVIKSDHLASGDLPAEAKKYKNLSHLTMGFGMDVFRRMKKIEHAIHLAVIGNYSEISQDELQAFQDFSHVETEDGERNHSNILFLESSKGVHAELHTLSHIIKEIERGNIPPPGEIHLGISKRCCYNCHYMIEAANEILEENGIKVSIKTAGSHFQEFSENWIAPDIFCSGIKEVEGNRRRAKKQGQATFLQGASEDPQSLAHKIGKRYAEKIECNPEPEVNAEQRHSSGSEYTPTSLDKLNMLKEKTKKHLDTYLELGDGESPVAKALKIGKKVCVESDTFQTLFDYIESNLLDSGELVEQFLYSILDEVRRSEAKEALVNDEGAEDLLVLKEHLLKFLTDSRFCGEEIAGVFSEMKLDAGKKEPLLSKSETKVLETSGSSKSTGKEKERVEQKQEAHHVQGRQVQANTPSDGLLTGGTIASRVKEKNNFLEKQDKQKEKENKRKESI